MTQKFPLQISYKDLKWKYAGNRWHFKKTANPVFSAVSLKYEEQNADVKYNTSHGSAYFLNVRKKSLLWEYLQGMVTLSHLCDCCMVLLNLDIPVLN